MVVEAGDRVIVWCAVEDLPDLLEEAFPVELGRAHESILPQENMLASQGGVEAAIKNDLESELFGANPRKESLIRQFEYGLLTSPSIGRAAFPLDGRG